MILDEVFSEPDMVKATYTVRIETHEVKNKKEMEAHYEEFKQQGLEGGVVRNLDAPYEFEINKEIRSYYSLKLKPRYDAEWPVVDFVCGNGKEEGVVIWVCAENEDGVKHRTGSVLPLEERLTFTVTPNQTYEERQHIYEKLSQDRDFFMR
jgi:ATP-dependent DNA ligase